MALLKGHGYTYVRGFLIYKKKKKKKKKQKAK